MTSIPSVLTTPTTVQQKSQALLSARTVDAYIGCLGVLASMERNVTVGHNGSVNLEKWLVLSSLNRSRSDAKRIRCCGGNAHSVVSDIWQCNIQSPVRNRELIHIIGFVLLRQNSPNVPEYLVGLQVKAATSTRFLFRLSQLDMPQAMKVADQMKYVVTNTEGSLVREGLGNFNKVVVGVVELSGREKGREVIAQHA
jgi:hypothetical protein